MSKPLILELTDDDYLAVECAAQAAGTTVTDWATKVLRDQAPLARESAPGTGLAPGGDELAYDALLQQTARQMSASYGGAAEEQITGWRARIATRPHPQLTKEEREVARQRLHGHLGAVQSGDPHFADNDRSDQTSSKKASAGCFQ